MYKVIDVSKHQGDINWQAVKAAGIDTAIIRCGFGDDIPSQDDPFWRANVERARAAGLRIGAFLYSYADSVAHAQSEASHAIRLLQGISLDLPIFYDMEDENTTGKCSPVLLGDMAEIFCKALQDAGYQVGIYANKYWFTNKLTDPRFEKWDKWVAQYYKECTYSGTKVGWQYTSTGSVDGVQGNVDISEFYKDYLTETVATTAPQEKLPDITGYKGTSIVGALNQFGYDSSYAYRATIAGKLGIGDYRGSAEQNLELIRRLGGVVYHAQPSKPSYTEYIVKNGDTLSGIAERYNTNYQSLAQYNRIADPNKIYVGQRIKIPN